MTIIPKTCLAGTVALAILVGPVAAFTPNPDVAASADLQRALYLDIRPLGVNEADFSRLTNHQFFNIQNILAGRYSEGEKRRRVRAIVARANGDPSLLTFLTDLFD